MTFPSSTIVLPDKLELEQDECWIVRVLAPAASTRFIPARQELFVAGERATNWYLLMSGDLFVFAPGFQSINGRWKPVVRFIDPDEPFIYACDSAHAANCVAISDCVVLCINRRQLARLVNVNPALRGVLHHRRAREIEFLLQPFCVDRGVAANTQPDQPDMDWSAYGPVIHR